MDRSQIVVTSEQQYTELTAVTWNFQDKEKDVLHCLLGISSELGELESALKKHIGYGKELDLVNVKEEIGDLLYFIFRLNTFFENRLSVEESKDYVIILTPSKFDNYSLIQVCNQIREFSFRSIDLMDKNYFDNKSLFIAFSNVFVLIKYFGFTDIYDIMTTNIRKLAVRFPYKFDSYLVSNRDLDKERNILDGNNS